MTVMLLAYYEVSDAHRFLDAFDAFEGHRRAAGARTGALVQSVEDSRAFVALIEFETLLAAKTFAESSDRVHALEDGGVLCHTDEFLEVVRPAVATAVA
jgi:hypothetical protein